jgi:hypothetical protein
MLQTWWKKTEGATVASHHLCYVAIAFIYFLFGQVFGVASAFSWFPTIVSMWLLY